MQGWDYWSFHESGRGWEKAHMQATWTCMTQPYSSECLCRTLSFLNNVGANMTLMVEQSALDMTKKSIGVFLSCAAEPGKSMTVS
jgi:hypothetical protein